MSENLKFAAVGDLHVGDIEDEAAETLVEVVNGLDIDFAIFLGDMVEKPAPEAIEGLTKYVKQIKHPTYLVTGNHDSSAAEEGFDIEAALREGIPGQWNEDTFTYHFKVKGWNFVTCGMTTGIIPYRGIQVNQYKGYMSEHNGVCRIPEHHLRRFKQLVEGLDDDPSVVCVHVPLTRMQMRLKERRCFCQVRLLEELQMLSIVEAKPNVKMGLYGHDHFNQIDFDFGGRFLHCISQSTKGYPPYKDPHAIRIFELSPDRIKSWLVWKDYKVDTPGEIGTLEGDKAFEWKF